MNNFKLIPTYNRWFENKDKTNDKNRQNLYNIVIK